MLQKEIKSSKKQFNTNEIRAIKHDLKKVKEKPIMIREHEMGNGIDTTPEEKINPSDPSWGKRSEVWSKKDYRDEWICEHHIGHGNHCHGCDGCCRSESYPGWGQPGTREQKGKIYPKYSERNIGKEI